MSIIGENESILYRIFILSGRARRILKVIFIFHKMRQSRHPTQKAKRLETSAMTAGSAGRLGAPAYQTADR